MLVQDHHAQLTYTIKESVPFNVDRTGVITVARSLDYETQTSYTFQVSVQCVPSTIITVMCSCVLKRT